MLLRLRISEFALIEECAVEFDSGFVALTGETGAGKSILMDALSACLGERVSTDAVRAGANKAELEAVFAQDQWGAGVTAILDEAGISDDDVLILNREISSGRSICRVNGRAVPLAMLKALGDELVDLHGQSEHLSILKPARQLDMLDHFAGLEQQRACFAKAAEDLVAARERLCALDSNRRSAEQRHDLLRFQISEIEGAGLEVGEYERLEEERVRLAHSEKLAALAARALDAVIGNDHPNAVDLVSACGDAIRSISSIDASVEPWKVAAEELQFNLRDLASSLRSYLDSLEFDTNRLDAVQTRMDQITRLCRKYGDTVDDVLGVLEQAQTELDQIEHHAERLEEAASAVAQAASAAVELAESLSRDRKAGARRLEKQVRERLAPLGLGPALFEVSLEREADNAGLPIQLEESVQMFQFTRSGIDQVRFLVAFNPGESLKPIERVASGGETARFMLAVKAALADADSVPTLIFDEIDTGVGGRSGATVANMLADLATSHQVVSITHLPQIAAAADQHLKVDKRIREGRSQITVQRLEGAERVDELAEMLAGAAASESAVIAARELLAQTADSGKPLSSKTAVQQR